MPKIYLQRHTQPDIAPQTCYGVSDVGLHQDFEHFHLPNVIDRLSAFTFATIYSSPLRRCLTLAQRVKQQLNYRDEIEIDPRLKELNFGDWEMLTWDEIYNTPEGAEWFDDYINSPTLNGESFAQMVERAANFLDEVTPLEGDILVVTHSGFCRAAMVALGRSPIERAFEIEIGYGELIEITI